MSYLRIELPLDGNVPTFENLSEAISRHESIFLPLLKAIGVQHDDAAQYISGSLQLTLGELDGAVGKVSVQFEITISNPCLGIEHIQSIRDRWQYTQSDAGVVFSILAPPNF